MNFYFAFPQHFISEEMAIAFLRENNILLKEGQKINSATIQVHRNKENSPLYFSFNITYQGGGQFCEFPFIDYYNWFELNKQKYIV